MPPRPRGSGGGAVAGGTLAMRAQAGQQQQQQRKQQQQQPPAQQPQQQQDVLYNTNNYKNNLSVVYFLRIYMTVVAGAAAGALGVTGWRGFALYLLSQAAVAPLVVLKAGGRTAKYFPGWCAWQLVGEGGA